MHIQVEKPLSPQNHMNGLFTNVKRKLCQQDTIGQEHQPSWHLSLLQLDRFSGWWCNSSKTHFIWRAASILQRFAHYQSQPVRKLKTYEWLNNPQWYEMLSYFKTMVLPNLPVENVFSKSYLNNLKHLEVTMFSQGFKYAIYPAATKKL